MRIVMVRALPAVASTLILVFATACGGGGGASSTTQTAVTTPSITIVTTTLPSTIRGHQYSATLVAANAQGPVKWSIAPSGPGTPFVDGLSIDSTTGILSGTVGFDGTAGFDASVTDGVHSANKALTLTAFLPLVAGPDSVANISEFTGNGASTTFSGGVPPLSFHVVSGSLPPGMRMDTSHGAIVGAASATGTFVATIQATDSFSPAETATQQLTLNVARPSLTVANSLPSRLPLNVLFSGRVFVRGGTPPYSFSLPAGQGTLPAGLAIDPSTGQVTGTPSAAGTFPFSVNVSDTSTPVQTAVGAFNITVDAVRGRNDSIANATVFPVDAGGNGSMTATISPYIDPPDKAPTVNDTDYYKLVAAAGADVLIETETGVFGPGNPLDTVLEIVDANGARFNTCREARSTAPFTSICLNDDFAPGTTDSALEFQVPGTAGTSVTFYIHVLDFRGDARPDMQYTLGVGGAKP
jgi:Putative Ig domain